MNPPGGIRPPPGPPGAWPGHGVPPTQVPNGQAPPGTYPAPQQPYPPHGYPQQGYPAPQQQYPQQPYPQQPYPQYPQHPQQPQYPHQGYPPPPGYPQMIVVQNQVNPYGGRVAGDARKKDVALLLAIVGMFIGVCGMQRFYLRQTGMGLLYLFTGGLCAIGQIVDIIQLATMSQQEFDMRYNVIR